MKITNHRQQNIRTLFVIMSVITLAWGNVKEVKGQYISITPTSIYPNSYAALANLLPPNIWNTIYDSSRKATYDYVLISIVLNDIYASALGWEANVPYIIVFEQNKKLKYESTPGSEEWFVLTQRVQLNNQTIIPSGILSNAAGKSFYYDSSNYPGGMDAFGVPYITPAGIIPNSASTWLETKLPVDYLQTLYNTTGKAVIDNLFIAMTFDASEVINVQNEFGVSVTTDQSYMMPFCKVICSDGQDYFVPIHIKETSNQNYTLDDIHNKKIYFTGTVDEAYAGAGITSEGFFFIKGTDDEQVDIYLQDFKINKVLPKDLGNMDIDVFMQGHMKGMAAPFSFGSTGENAGENNIFRVRIHTKGHNTLTGGATSTYKGIGNILQAFSDIVTMKAAPISIRPVARKILIGGIETDETDLEYKTCEITFDDKWIRLGTEIRTNGLLELPVEGDRSAPSIDLGTRYGRCVFDGGRYKFTTAGSDNMFYVSSMAICYRMFEMMGITKYGVGSSVGSPVTNPEDNAIGYPTVLFKDGTFTTYSAEEFKSTIDVVAHGWYKDYTDLRVPFKTRIDGGTFNNCNVYRCNASAEQGVTPINSNLDALCRTQISTSTPDATTGLTPLDLNASHPYYGTSSLTPIQENGQYYVYPYLPGECESSTEYMHNWVTIIPQMGVEGLLTMGGNIKVNTKIDDITPQKNAYLFYTRLNEYTKKNASVSFGFASATVADAINLGGNYEFTKVTNTGGYTIEHGLYTMLSFESNKWYTICPPYDVHNIYVIETLPDEKLAEHGLTKADKGTSKYLKAQGKCDGVLAQGVITSLCPDILSGKGSGVRMNLIEICRKTLGIEPYKITHYNPALPGHSSKEANYYLYEQVQDAEDEQGESEFPGAWTKANNLEDYSEKWKYATPVEGNTYTDQDGNTFTAPILMQRDSVYSILLPAGNDKYWDGKYLIFEGYGPQELHGTTEAEDYRLFPTILDIYEYSNDQFFLAGNGSFTNLHITSDELDWDERIYLPSTDGLKHDFVRANVGDSILPWQAYLAMNGYNTETYATLSALSPSKATMQAAPAAEDLTQTPLVQECSLMAYNQNGIMMQAYAQQMIAVYSVDGSLIWKGALNDGDRKHLSVPTGVYIIQGEQETTKIVVRE